MGINRYTFLKNTDGTLKDFPKITISNRVTDRYVQYNSNKTRLDRISADAYDDDTYGWLILLANPEYFVEFDITNNSIVRVPYPLQDVLTEFQNKIINDRDK